MKTLYFAGGTATLIQPKLLPSAKRLRAAAAELLATPDPATFHSRVERIGKLLAAADEVEAAAGDRVDIEAERIVQRMRAEAAA